MLGLKTEFMNQAAHDLRTPLMPILTLLPVLEKKIKNKKDRYSLSIIRNNANYLSKIVENLVHPKNNDYNLFIDGVPTTGKVGETKLMAHIPILLHKNPLEIYSLIVHPLYRN